MPFLHLAAAGRVVALVTGDADLWSLGSCGRCGHCIIIALDILLSSGRMPQATGA
jgi:hypothetical protein